MRRMAREAAKLMPQPIQQQPNVGSAQTRSATVTAWPDIFARIFRLTRPAIGELCRTAMAHDTGLNLDWFKLSSPHRLKGSRTGPVPDLCAQRRFTYINAYVSRTPHVRIADESTACGTDNLRAETYALR
jgi:hypothetical protein